MFQNHKHSPITTLHIICFIITLLFNYFMRTLKKLYVLKRTIKVYIIVNNIIVNMNNRKNFVIILIRHE